jgi:tryptophan synthase beta chain
VKAGVFEARAYPQTPVFESAVKFARAEGFVPGPEPAHAVKAVEDEALAALEADEERVILFNLSGHGHFDLGAFDAYLRGELQDYPLPDGVLEDSLTTLPPQPEPR